MKVTRDRWRAAVWCRTGRSSSSAHTGGQTSLLNYCLPCGCRRYAIRRIAGRRADWVVCWSNLPSYSLHIIAQSHYSNNNNNIKTISKTKHKYYKYNTAAQKCRTQLLRDSFIIAENCLYLVSPYYRSVVCTFFYKLSQLPKASVRGEETIYI